MVWSITGMRSCVTPKRDSLREALVAMVAFEWLFASMNARMCSQVWILCERFVAELATERPIPGVSSDVVSKMRRLSEGFFAVHTLKSLLFLSSFFVLWWRQRGWRRRQWKSKLKGCWTFHGLSFGFMKQRGKPFLSEPAVHVMRFHLHQLVLVKAVGIHAFEAKLTVAMWAICKVRWDCFFNKSPRSKSPIKFK